MGGQFLTRTNIPLSSVIAHKDPLYAFCLPGCYDLPFGPALELIYQDKPIGHGVIEHLIITKHFTSGRVRKISAEEKDRIQNQTHGFVHNYILWPDQLSEPVTVGTRFTAVKDKRRRYPIGTPIDLALGTDFQIVASVVVDKLTITDDQTVVEGVFLMEYFPEDSHRLTTLNRRRETLNKALQKSQSPS